MKQRSRLAWTLSILALAAPAWPAVYSIAGLAGPLDNGGAGARALAMGSAFVGVADDASALYWNPAGLSNLDGLNLALHHNAWLAGIVQETAEAAAPAGILGAFGASVDYISYGTFAGYDASGASTADYSANRYGFDLGWGKELLRGFSAGAALKGSSQAISGSTYNNLAADLGLLWKPAPGLGLGLTWTNLGNQVAGYAQASDLNLGASYGLKPRDDNRLLLAVSGTWEPNGVNRMAYGLEDVVHEFMALRVGYDVGDADTQIQGLANLSLGLGLMIRGFELDYAYLPYGDLGTAQRLSLTYAFGPHGRARE
jgi:hypothetical protein